MRYRYIFSGGVKATNNIARYRLLDKQKMQGVSHVIRVEISDDAILEKWDCDEYSTWDSSNANDYQLSELNPKICVKINGRWAILEDATNEWLGGKEMEDAIHDSIKEKYHQVPVYNIGYLTTEQYKWYRDQSNIKYAWRFDRLPTDLENVKIPSLTPAQLETLDFVRGQFQEHCKEAIDESFYFDDNDKEEATEFFQNFIQIISNDDLAYEWHRISTTGLDPNQKFETKEMVDKIKRSRYGFVHDDHYKYAIKNMIDNMAYEFRSYMREKEDDLERC